MKLMIKRSVAQKVWTRSGAKRGVPGRRSVAIAVAAAGVALTGQSARAQSNDAYSPDATSGVFSTSFTDGTTTPTLGGMQSPASGDALFFGPVTTGTTTANNDLSNFVYSGLTFNTGAPAFTVGGNAFFLAGNISNGAGVTQTLNTAIAVTAGTNGLALNTNLSNLTLGGGLTGSGTLSQTGTTAGVTTATLSADNSGFTGAFTQDNATSTRTAFTTAAAGSAAAAWTFNRTVGGGVALYFAGATISFGSLAGGGFIRSNNAGTDVLSVGALNTSTTFSGLIQTNGTNNADAIALTKVGTGTLTLTGPSTYTGDTNITAGEVDVVGGGFAGSTLQYTSQGGTLGFGSGTGGTIGSLNGSQNLALTNAAAAAATLTLAGANAATYTGVLSGAGGLTKTGTAVQALTAANTYTGPTTVGGGTLLDTGTASTANSVVTVGIPGGNIASTLTVTPTAAGTTTRSAGLTYSGSFVNGNNAANFNVNGVAAGQTVENFGPLTLNPGLLRGLLTPNAAANVQVVFSSVTRNAGSQLDFDRGTAPGTATVTSATAATANVVFTTAPTLVGGGGAAGTQTISVLPYAFVNNTIATYDATSGLRALTTAEQAPLATTLTSTTNARITGNTALATATSVNSLATLTGNYTVTLGAGTAGDTTALTVSSGAMSFGQTTTIGAVAGDGVLNFGTAEGNINVSNVRGLAVNSVITGSAGLTVGLDDLNNATATVALYAANTYTGLTRVTGNATAMTVRLLNGLALQNSTLDYNNYGAAIQFGTAATTASSSVPFTLAATDVKSATLGGLQGAQSLPLTNAGTAGGGVALTVGGDGDSTTYGGVLSNAAGSLAKAGGGTLTLTAANTYGGGTTVTGGTLRAASATTSLGTGTTNINGGVLAGTGATGGPVTFTAGNITGGTGMTAGDTIGTLTVGATATPAAVTLAGAADTYTAKLDGSTLGTTTLVTNKSSGVVSVQTSGSDQLVLSSLTAGGNTLTINPVLVTAGAGGFTQGQTYTFVIADAKSNATAFDGLVALSTTALASQQYALDFAPDGGTGEDLLLSFTPTAAPEPTSLLLAAVAAGPLALGRRRRRSLPLRSSSPFAQR